MKQTAVEFLVDEFKEKLMGDNLPDWVLAIIDQAKVMEKEQIEMAHTCGGYGEKEAEEYYNETFKSE
jgi:hypothetical protein